MMPFLVRAVRGLGDTASQAAGVAESATGIAASTGLSVAGSTGAIAASTASLAIPIVGAAIAGVSLLVNWLLNKNAVYHAQETATSNDANAVEQQMIANLAAFNACSIDEATAEANFQQLWAELQAACQKIGGPAGTRCITDRQAGACVLKNSGDNTPSGSGNVCWNWFTGYEPAQQAQPACAAASGSGGGLSEPWLLAIAGGALLVLGATEA